MTELETKAWERYCEDTAGSMDVKDFWEELSPTIRSHYMNIVANEPREHNNAR